MLVTRGLIGFALVVRSPVRLEQDGVDLLEVNGLGAVARSSRCGNFGGDGGDLSQGEMDVLRKDLLGLLSSGGEPGGLGEQIEGSGIALGGLGQQVDGGGLEDVAIQAGPAEVPAEVAGEQLAWQRGELVGGADAREQGALDREAKAAQEVLVTEEHESKGVAPGCAETEEEADFLQGRGGIVLGVVEDVCQTSMRSRLTGSKRSSTVRARRARSTSRRRLPRVTVPSLRTTRSARV